MQDSLPLLCEATLRMGHVGEFIWAIPWLLRCQRLLLAAKQRVLLCKPHRELMYNTSNRGIWGCCCRVNADCVKQGAVIAWHLQRSSTIY